MKALTKASLKLKNSAMDYLPGLWSLADDLRCLRYLRAWRKNGWSLPPPYLIKRAMIKAEANRIGAEFLVETGTYLGDTVWYMRNDCAKIYSIEIQPDLAELARKRFKHLEHVDIITGDSSVELMKLIPDLNKPVLFWLDGHYSGGITGSGREECPLMSELAAIRSAKTILSIMIDDARCFGTEHGYPKLQEVLDYADNQFPEHRCRVENDVVFVVPS